MITRFPSKKLFDKNTSPYVKSLILQQRAGIKLNEQQIKRLEREQLNETVSMVEIPKNRKQNVPPKVMVKPDEVDDYNELDLDEVLREMGYGDEEDGDEDELEVVVREIEDELGIGEERWGYYGDTTIDVSKLTLNQIRDLIYKTLTDREGEDLEEGITYDIEYVSYKRPDKKKYYTKRKTFNDEKHLSNWISWLNKNDAKVIGVHPLK